MSSGLISLVAFPLYGIVKEGFTGFMKGATLGLITSSLLSLSGLFLGTVQITKGLINTPSAFISLYKGKIWDNLENKWIYYNLKKEYQDFHDKKYLYQEKFLNKSSIDYELYNILELNNNCTQKDIRKSYHRLAFKYHPDKNILDKNISDKFKNINKAYQILNDPVKRNNYDLNGINSINKNLDYRNYYNLFFQNEEINNFIGEVNIFDYIDSNKNHHYFKFKKKKREIDLANNLCNFLNHFSKKVKDYDIYYDNYIRKMFTNDFSKYIINIIGIIYVEISTSYISYFSYFYNSIKSNFRYIENNISLLSSFAQINYTRIQDSVNTCTFTDFILSSLIYDLENIISDISYKILNDTSVSNNEKIKRAEALNYIGNKFINDTSYKKAKEFFDKKISEIL